MHKRVGASILGLFALACVAGPTVELGNHLSGISISLSGTNGTDWAVEQTFHDATVADQVFYVKDHVEFSLAHNEFNTLCNIYHPQRLVGRNGMDGLPDSGDEGIIHYKIDRDMQSHAYVAAVPAWAPVFREPFSFARLTDEGRKILGSVGDNGGAWGPLPLLTTNRYAYGMNDSFGNEWHVLTYWDDDVAMLEKAKVKVHRQGASDGHCVAICVNPRTPVLQFSASGAEQYYTTPLKVYHIPVIREQTTYLTKGVRIHFVNLTTTEPVHYRVDEGAFKPYEGVPLEAGGLFNGADSRHVLEFKCGKDGVVCRRVIQFEPGIPAPDESHGYLLWANEADRIAVVEKILNTEPFKTSYRILCNGYPQGGVLSTNATRREWSGESQPAGASLCNAFLVAVEGPEKQWEAGLAAKARLLRLSRLQPVGLEADLNADTPGKDFLNELGQTTHHFADAGVAYDLLAGYFRRGDHPRGMTPIEERQIRDGLAKIVHALLGRTRENWTIDLGGGSAHWSHGFELVAGIMALAMPSYKTPYYGVSGGDRVTVNDLPLGPDGKLWTPYPDLRVTWYQVATDPFLPSTGWPNSRTPFRAEFILSDDGWWVGPNDLVGDGARYHAGVIRNQLVDVGYGGLANAECRIELAEDAGYEGPFVERLQAFCMMRKIKGDDSLPLGVRNYTRRQLVHGVTRLQWDKDRCVYTPAERLIHDGLISFSKYNDFAALPEVKGQVSAILSNLNIYYGITPGVLDEALKKRIDQYDRKLFYDPYYLAYCAVPASLPVATNLPASKPILKPLYKYVVKPGERVSKSIIAIDLNEEPLSLVVTNLPGGARYDEKTGVIEWVPGAGDEGVHLVTVTAFNRAGSTTRPFPIIVKADAGKGPIPAGPRAFAAMLAPDGRHVSLKWNSPAGDEDVAFYFLYRDGIFIAAIPAETKSYDDAEYLMPGSHTRYHLSCVSRKGAESPAVSIPEDYVTVPKR